MCVKPFNFRFYWAFKAAVVKWTFKVRAKGPNWTFKVFKIGLPDSFWLCWSTVLPTFGVQVGFELFFYFARVLG